MESSLLDIEDILLVNEFLLQQASYAISVMISVKKIMTTVKRLLLCGYNIVGNNNGLASVGDMAVLFTESHDG